MSDRAYPLTDNGLHLTAIGYWQTAAALEQGLGLARLPWRVEISADGKIKAQGTKAVRAGELPLGFRLTDASLPSPPPPEGKPDADRVLRLRGLKQGYQELRIDGKANVSTATEQWNKGVKLPQGPEFDQAERLRKLIVEKNQLYFHRWRPQNDTYLFGFRKYEQGQNAVEIPKFDPLVEKLEKEIAKLRVPMPHEYELVPAQ